MRNRVAENAEPHRRLDCERRFAPIVEIGERVTFCSPLLFHGKKRGRVGSRPKNFTDATARVPPMFPVKLACARNAQARALYP